MDLNGKDMKLIKVNDFKLEVDDELFLLKPFKELYKSDKSKNKSDFFNFLTILYFTYDPRSDYMYITNESDRLKEVCETNGIKIKKFTDKENDCKDLYIKCTKTSSSLLLEDTRATVDNIRKMLQSINFDSMEEKDKVIALKNITSVTSMIPKLIKDLSDAEKAVIKEIDEQGRARGGNKKSLFEDGISL